MTGDTLARLLDPATLAAVDTCDRDRIPEVLGACAALQARAFARLAQLVTTSATSTATTGTLLDVETAAQRIGMSPDWLYRNAPKLPFTRRVGRRALRFDAVALDRWMATRAR